MGYYTLLIILNVFALRKIYYYNPTKKSMKKYISQLINQVITMKL